VTFSGTDRR